jgi:hypothetical protein
MTFGRLDCDGIFEILSKFHSAKSCCGKCHSANCNYAVYCTFVIQILPSASLSVVILPNASLQCLGLLYILRHFVVFY